MKKSECFLYITKVTDADYDELFNEYGDRFESKRTERIKNSRNINVRNIQIAAGVSLAKVMAKYGKDLKDVSYTEAGKPYFAGQSSLFYNMSHSGDYIVIAVSGQDIGVDIQKESPYNEKLLRRILSEKELIDLNEKAQNEFNYLWACKESYSKLTGKGIASDFTGISFSEERDRLVYYESGAGAGYGISLKIIDGYAIVICARDRFNVSDITNICLQ